jgi:hypothetical protein
MNAALSRFLYQEYSSGRNKEIRFSPVFRYVFQQKYRWFL